MSQPYLKYMLTQSYAFISNDKGTGAHDDVSFWTQQPCPGGWFIMGDVGSPSETIAPTNGTWLVQIGQDASSGGSLLYTEYQWGYNHVNWLYQEDDISIAEIIPPAGYVSIGVQGGNQYGTNNNTGSFYVFLRQDQVVSVQPSQLTLLYTNKGAHTSQNITLWTLPNSGLVVASVGALGSYPTGPIYDIPPQTPSVTKAFAGETFSPVKKKA